jgi:hypothetical protein
MENLEFNSIRPVEGCLQGDLSFSNIVGIQKAPNSAADART